ncbi:endonuclease/exonuclease/phosphatase family protein [Actinoplanes aureus]|uniref:Endonuclease/exonuclease/phosphatase family protein n=1 Tax=Actinoplanes aureus TaxID=2792083 RepID=A0A931FWY6_9ACTN|nr:endonuclease/exonuclease/phosphatase family protein [Actinoplanes aureus]MBG0560251.1 endonuclease/exonuclease/phosphatase family protein [Actinoplanes aureus]
MTWNIRTGGGDRLPAIIEVVQAERPDILALQELRDFHRYGRMHDFATAVGMTPHLARSVLGQPVAVLVRPPLRILRRSSVTWRLHHAAAIVEVATEAGPLRVVSTHLNPFWPYLRMREARWLAARYAGDRVLIAGDMNGLDPHGDHTEALAALPSMYRRRHLTPDGTPDTGAIAAFEAAGLVDLWPAAGAGPGETVPTTGLRGKEFGSTRLDYLFAGPAVAAHARAMWVIRGGATEHASDHYPVTADFELS